MKKKILAILMAAVFAIPFVSDYADLSQIVFAEESVKDKIDKASK